MRTALLVCVLLCPLASAQVEINSSQLSVPRYGVFYSSGGAQIELGEVHPVDVKTRHAFRGLTPGLTPQLYYVYRSKKAPDQLDEMRPTFGILLPRSYGLADLHLLRLKQTSTGRELAMSSGRSVFTFRLRFPRKEVVECDAKPGSGDTFIVTPKTALAPGEYLFVLGPTAAFAWDFGIQ